MYCFNAKKGKGRVVAGVALMLPNEVDECVRSIRHPRDGSGIEGRVGSVRLVGVGEGGMVMDMLLVVVYAKPFVTAAGMLIR